jgi:hypothetical protein
MIRLVLLGKRYYAKGVNAAARGVRRKGASHSSYARARIDRELKSGHLRIS